MKNVIAAAAVAIALVAAMPAQASDLNSRALPRSNDLPFYIVGGAVVGGVVAVVLCPPCAIGAVALTSLGAAGVGAGVGAGSGAAIALVTNRGGI